MRSRFSSSLQGFFPKHVCIDGTLAENRCSLQRNDCWEYIMYVHDFCTESLCYVAWAVVWSAPYQNRQSHSAWPLASKHCHKPSLQLDDDLPAHGSNPGMEPEAARSVSTTRQQEAYPPGTPGGKNYEQKLLAARILTEKAPRWCIWNSHILRGFRIHHRAPVKNRSPGGVYVQKTSFFTTLRVYATGDIFCQKSDAKTASSPQI